MGEVDELHNRHKGSQVFELGPDEVFSLEPELCVLRDDLFQELEFVEVEVDVVLHRFRLQLGPYLYGSQLAEVGSQVVGGEDEGEGVAGVEVGQDVVEHLGVVDDELSALGGRGVEVDVGKSLVDLPHQDAAQLFDGGLLVSLQVAADAFVFVEGDALCDAGQEVEEEAEAEGVQGQVLGSYVLGTYALELDCSSEDDELVAGGVVGLEQFVDLHTYLLRHEGVQLSQLHVVLHDLQQKQQRLRHLVAAALHDDLAADYAEVARLPFLPHPALPHPVHEHARVEHSDAVAQRVGAGATKIE